MSCHSWPGTPCRRKTRPGGQPGRAPDLGRTERALLAAVGVAEPVLAGQHRGGVHPTRLGEDARIAREGGDRTAGELGGSVIASSSGLSVIRSSRMKPGDMATHATPATGRGPR